MRTLIHVLALAGFIAIVVSGCGSSGNSSDGGTGGSTGGTTGTTGTTGDDDGGYITVSGTVALNPIVVAAQADGTYTGPTASFTGETLFIDEPLIATAQGVEQGRLATSTLDSSGTFTVTGVPLQNIQIGLVGTIAGKSEDGGFAACEGSGTAPAFCDDYARSVSLVYENLRPTADVTGAPLFGVPVKFTELLSSKLGLAQGNDLLDQGFVMGLVLQPDGGPLAGATFDTNGGIYPVTYLDDQLQPGGSATNKYGMFLLIAPGQPQPQYKFAITGHPEYKCHRVGSQTGTVLSLVYDVNHPGIDCQ